jgi:hypothetical protein
LRTLISRNLLSRKLVSSMFALALFGALTVGSQTPAHAWFGSCSMQLNVGQSEAWGYCAGGGNSQFRVWVSCKFLGVFPRVALGELRQAGGFVTSHAKCPGVFEDAGIDKFGEGSET